MGVYIYANLIWIYTPKDNNLISFLIRKTVIVFIILLFMTMPFMFSWIALIIFISIMVIVIFFVFLFPLITQRDKKTYSEKLIGQMEIEESVDKHTLYKVIDNKMGEWFIGFILITMITIVYSYLIGLHNAESKKYFFVTDKNTVILAIYNDLIITSTYDQKSKELTGLLKILKIDQDNNISISEERIGELKMPKIDQDNNISISEEKIEKLTKKEID